MVFIFVLNDANRISKCKKIKKIQAEIKLNQLSKHLLIGENSFVTIYSYEFTNIGGLIYRGRS